jgi:hypothetical protein
MVTLAEIEVQAMFLSESERAILASRLLCSLPPLLNDGDEGADEALRRDAEMDSDPSACLSLEEFKSATGR